MTHAQLSVGLCLGLFAAVVFAAVVITRAARQSREEAERMASEAFERHRDRGDM